MNIRELSRDECCQVLGSTRLARLACAKDNQPYIVPVYLAFHQVSGNFPFLYGFMTPGQKVNWMRANPQVCVLVDKIEAFDDWVSVVVLGRFEELSESEQLNNEHQEAWEILKTQPEWWEPGSMAHLAVNPEETGKAFTPLYYRINIEEMTGHKGCSAARQGIAAVT